MGATPRPAVRMVAPVGRSYGEGVVMMIASSPT